MSEQTLELAGGPLHVYVYKPATYRAGEVLVVLHGLGRNAAGYRNYARPLADRHGLLTVVPRFDRERFPTWRYQQGGIARMEHDEILVQPEERWIASTVDDVIAAVRKIEDAPALRYSLLGHSAGAQALSRYAAFPHHDARRIVIANPSTYLWPALEVRYPFGYGGLPATLAGDDDLRRYLAQPVVVLLGTEDVRQDRDLNVTPGAAAQGANRYERGMNYFRAGERIARERGWSFGWRLIAVPGSAHSARAMFASEEAARAVGD
ncbi:MAG TPA: hypothetical protein VNT02_01340 [Burkholderiales bacterium]|nr:hypothetical protein [Burkholderiales bacterium]